MGAQAGAAWVPSASGSAIHCEVPYGILAGLVLHTKAPFLPRHSSDSKYSRSLARALLIFKFEPRFERRYVPPHHDAVRARVNLPPRMLSLGGLTIDFQAAPRAEIVLGGEATPPRAITHAYYRTGLAEWVLQGYLDILPAVWSTYPPCGWA